MIIILLIVVIIINNNSNNNIFLYNFCKRRYFFAYKVLLPLITFHFHSIKKNIFCTNVTFLKFVGAILLFKKNIKCCNIY